jgi:hypothetical protein
LDTEVVLESDQPVELLRVAVAVGLLSGRLAAW